MNKRKIFKLFGGLSTTAVLATTGATFLTACSNTNTDSNFTEGLAKSLEVRYLATEETPYPVYAMPKQSPELMAPNFKAINEKRGDPLETALDFDPNTGWPTLDSLQTMKYSQFFMNDDVTTAMTPSGHSSSDKFVLNDLITDLASKKTLNLKSKYKYDDYADETIKVFNCPYFYNEVSGNSVYSNIQTIDLSDNNLWYLPFFGYDASGTTDDAKYIMKQTLTGKKGFTSLANTANTINLQDNQITLLPFADKVTIGGEEVNQDITNLFAETDKNTIAIDGNCIGYDLKGNSILAYRSYNNLDSINFGKDDKGYGYQSYAVYTNREAMYDQVVSKCAKALNESKDDFIKRSLDKHIDEIQKLSSVMADMENKYPLGDCLNQLVAEYLNNNGLVSAYIYTKYEVELTILIQLFSNSDFVYDYPSFSSNNGCLNFSLQLGTPRICVKEGNGYVNKYATGQGSYFIAFSVYGFEATNIMAIIVGVLIAIVAIALAFVIIYYAWLRKVIARKRQLKDLQAISAAQNKDNKGGKKDA